MCIPCPSFFLQHFSSTKRGRKKRKSEGRMGGWLGEGLRGGGRGGVGAAVKEKTQGKDV